jgi:hypothetical protein
MQRPFISIPMPVYPGAFRKQEPGFPRKAGSRLDAQDARGRTGAGLRAPKCASQPQRPPPAGSGVSGSHGGLVAALRGDKQP